MLIQDQVHCDELDSGILEFYSAIGVDTIHLETRGAVDVKGHEMNFLESDFSVEPLLRIRKKVENHGMQLNNLFYACPRTVTLGLEGADKSTESWCRMLESLGAAGIPMLGWNFKPMGNFRTESAIGRGGAYYSTFDYSRYMRELDSSGLHIPEVSEEKMWERLERFLRIVIPVAEEAGVTMALHPDDPPVPEPLGGVWQVCSTTDQWRRILGVISSDSHRMLFCQGCMTELLGGSVYDFIGEIASGRKMAYVHFRNVRGQLPYFEEVFIDEGDIDMRKAMEAYRDHGFNGPFMMDHTPRFPNGQSERVGKAFANGYIRRLIQEVYGT